MTVHVESVGRGPPLVLLHGWAMHSGLWAPLLPRLIGRYRVHLVDLPGHGYSSALEAPLSLTRIVKAVDDAVARAPESHSHSHSHAERATVMGWSLGGQVALEWAHTVPGRVGALVLMSTTPSFIQRPGWSTAMSEITLRRFGDELRVAYRPTLKRFLALQVQGSDHARDALASLRAELFARGDPSAQALSDSLELLAAVDLRREIGTITQPALVIGGDRDTMGPIAAVRWLASALPRATLAVIPGAAHAPFLSHPDAVVAAFDAFARDR
jgi:pimeloyl-[acyl-carrier protein] methyl ester esterase